MQPSDLKLKLWKTRIGRRAALLLLASAIAFLGHYELAGPNGYLALRRKENAFEAEQAHYQQLQQENERLNQAVRELKTDPAAIERIAREQLHLTRPGEVVYTFPKH